VKFVRLKKEQVCRGGFNPLKSTKGSNSWQICMELYFYFGKIRTQMVSKLRVEPLEKSRVPYRDRFFAEIKT
jgi:hypothetical protein